MAWGERQGRPSDYSAFAIADCGHSIPDFASLNPATRCVSRADDGQYGVAALSSLRANPLGDKSVIHSLVNVSMVRQTKLC
jgi:hypothetical protein